MSGYGGGESVLGSTVKWFVVGLVAIVALKLIVPAIVVILKVGFHTLLKIAPILLVGWLVLKLLRYLIRDRDAVPLES